MIVFSEEP